MTKNGLTPGSAPESNGPVSDVREKYEVPSLEPLGKWKALTLQQTIPIGPGEALAPGLIPEFYILP